jgi:hypothetical protein
MDILVVNGEPVAYGNSYGPVDFRRFFNEVQESAPGTFVEGGDADVPPRTEKIREQIQQLIQRSYEEKNERGKKIILRLSEKSFGFVAEDCCSEHDPYNRPSVRVLKQDGWGGMYHSRKQVRGCQCGECNDTNIWNAYRFIREKTGVTINV